MQQHVRKAFEWAKEQKMWKLAEYLQPYATGSKPIPAVPAARSTFAWYVAGVLGQRVRFSEAQARRKRLYMLVGTSDVTRDHLRQYGGPEGISFKLAIELEVAKRLWSLVEEPDDQRLSECYGVGEWTTKNVMLMESLTDANPLPIYVTGDKMLQRRITLHQLPSPEQWGEHTGIITWLLWR